MVAAMFLLVFLLGGFILPKRDIPNWWIWGYWISPLSYAFNAFSVNEMLAPRWSKPSSDGSTTLGIATLNNFDAFTEKEWYWIGAAALLGFTILYNVLFTLALMYLIRKISHYDKFFNKVIYFFFTSCLLLFGSLAIGNKQAIISEEEASEMESGGEIAMQRMSSRGNPSGIKNADPTLESATGVAPKRGTVLPFQPLAMSFDSVNYYVDMPAEMKEQGVTNDRLQLLRDVTGAFRPRVLTTLMGVSGAGKTTLMDVLAGRKTGGFIEGDNRISGFPKNQETIARISGYCEQTDIPSPQVTVRESVIYSAFLRLPREVSNEEKMKFVDEVMDLVELDNLRDAM